MAVRLKNTSDRPKAIRVPGKILTVDPGKEISVTAKLSDEYRKRLAEVGVIAAKDAEPSEDDKTSGDGKSDDKTSGKSDTKSGGK